MSDAPERIYTGNFDGEYSEEPWQGATVYIRADIHQAVVKELDAVRAMLRIECEEEGCNDWTDDLHLADVIEKHLVRKLAHERDAWKRKYDTMVKADGMTVYVCDACGKTRTGRQCMQCDINALKRQVQVYRANISKSVMRRLDAQGFVNKHGGEFAPLEELKDNP